MHVEVVRSARRRRTVELRPTRDGVRISIPSNATREEEQQYVTSLLAQYQNKLASNEFDLEGRAKRLAKRFNLKTPSSIRWVDNQKKRWGSCTPADGSIRISRVLIDYPAWVIDYVIVHELAHLSFLYHNDSFWALVQQYPLCERARGFLIAKGLENELGEQDSPDEAVAINDTDDHVPSAPSVIDLREHQHDDEYVERDLRPNGTEGSSPQQGAFNWFNN